MAKLVFGLNQSLDGYVDHLNLAPSPAIFRHFVELTRGLAGSVYGRVMYETMRYWDDDQSDWGADQRDFAATWRKQPKWVVSHSLKSVGPNATLIDNDVEAAVRGLKAQVDGEIWVGGPALAKSLGDFGLIDEIDSTCVPSWSATESHSSPARGRRSVLWPAISSPTIWLG